MHAGYHFRCAIRNLPGRIQPQHQREGPLDGRCHLPTSSEAGSPSHVSKWSRSVPVSDELRTRVEAALKELEYRPNLVARNLRRDAHAACLRVRSSRAYRRKLAPKSYRRPRTDRPSARPDRRRPRRRRDASEVSAAFARTCRRNVLAVESPRTNGRPPPGAVSCSARHLQWRLSPRRHRQRRSRPWHRTVSWAAGSAPS
ncbi:LacI family DNA-binding transcriptional regulator [Streptomyces sp. DHE17-7]|nr:LacI family DNA-binding transcriptional regulator [Streptomyces sp. DHE17-7]MBJ6623379.1 LacI family DNA-binding transcriptional regulator [Streptomyces sp. DHE17-7]